MNSFKDLHEFIETATRNRKYPAATAQGLRAAVKLFESELNEDEQASLEKVKVDLDRIYQSVFAKNKNSFTAASLATYRSRLLKVMNDYEKYGTDPTKMANWNPKIIVRSPKKKMTTQSESAEQLEQSNNENINIVGSSMHRLDLALRPGIRFTIVVPQDLKTSEAVTLNSILLSLAVDKKEMIHE